MKIPKKLKVGNHYYSIKMAKSSTPVSERKYWGVTSFNDCSIGLNSEIPQSKLEETFIHEILHICFDQAGIKRTDEDEEYLVNAIAMQLYSILEENKLLK